ncbi:hypothetical protein COW80_03110 [Candidatus Beckwithbacteria bacterium CG22_combo_CG10-13_8_21_14_all_01_47_9]|uniref:Isoprenylcysteine carboxyl methyltransferase n=1 Tax=Candidatus Beckwithbacteria bacterium CG22_combo_CG10-13_8_21_14_all_01_47_9 TaxID=1974496 RepID=A0A2H0E0K5_9BACT|nr:MAG: hypothetical protein COW80_03110 [Candidatus Beckwithbacteria bacterium CG22_combo_CG10-13_8_21_14_all_01_47_9]
MKVSMRQVKSFIFGTSIAFFLWIVMPAILISWNQQLDLPVYGNFVSRTIGIIFGGIGLISTLLIVNEHFKTGRVTPVAVEKPLKFIVKGVYCYSRNPMYITIILTFFGGWLFFGHFLLLVYVLLAFPVLPVFIIYKEEPELKKIFGKEYLDYLKRVPRWL